MDRLLTKGWGFCGSQQQTLCTNLRDGEGKSEILERNIISITKWLVRMKKAKM